MGFLARSTRKPVVENFRRVLAPGGRAVVGYGSGPGRDYAFEQFLADAREAGLNVDNTYSSWQMHPFVEGSSEFFGGGAVPPGGIDSPVQRAR